MDMGQLSRRCWIPHWDNITIREVELRVGSVLVSIVLTALLSLSRLWLRSLGPYSRNDNFAWEAMSRLPPHYFERLARVRTGRNPRRLEGVVRHLKYALSHRQHHGV